MKKPLSKLTHPISVCSFRAASNVGIMWSGSKVLYGPRFGRATSVVDGEQVGLCSHCSIQSVITGIKLWCSLYVEPPVVSSTSAALRHFEPLILGWYCFVVVIGFNDLRVNNAPCFLAPVVLAWKKLFQVCAINCPPNVGIPIRRVLLAIDGDQDFLACYVINVPHWGIVVNVFYCCVANLSTSTLSCASLGRSS